MNPHPFERSMRTTAASLVMLMICSVVQVALVGGVDPAGWREDGRNPRTNGFGVTEQRPLLATDGSPLDMIVDDATMSVIRQLNGAADDAGRDRGWLRRSRSDRPIRTTVDPRIQAAAAREVGGRRATAVVVDVSSGRLLAAAGAGGVDPSTAVPPASLWKLPLYGAALDSGTILPTTTFDRETTYLGIRNAGGRACGGTLAQVIAASCNTAAQRVAEALGAQRLAEVATAWDFEPPERTSGLESTFPSSQSLADPEVFVGAAIGHGGSTANPLWAASMAAAIANGGVWRPVSALGDSDGARKVLDRDSAETLLGAMRRAVTAGTATRAQRGTDPVAAKTGTAESGVPGQYHGWAVAVAPAHRPRVAVAVLVLGAPDDDTSGGRDAGPVAGAILAEALAVGT